MVWCNPPADVGADDHRQSARQDESRRGREEHPKLAGLRIGREEQCGDLGLVSELGDEHTQEDDQVEFHALRVPSTAEGDAVKLRRSASYCQTHHRAAHTYFVLRLLGYPRLVGYDRSWSEWGNRDDLPLAR
jgi:hypothetical protein